MAKDDLKLKDLFTRLVNWIKGKFSEQDTKIAANKYTLPQATETSLGGVRLLNKFTDEPSLSDRYRAATVNYVIAAKRSMQADIGMVLSTTVTKDEFDSKVSPATASKDGTVKLLDNQDSVLYSQYQGTAAGVSHVDNVVKSFEVGMNAQLNLKQDKIKIVTTEPTASSTASDPEGTIYFKV
ncbi:hypothetical protein [Murdochiella massiliensis]|uniref:hypothetical protein n=1 Tax=Murdochiella massiliensis TaxID=1673723 RepID=UPI0008344794|nr:hypothetical protein [Murdochiella massiliensis]